MYADMNTQPFSQTSSSVFSWLGFGIAAALLLLIWIVNIIAFKLAGEAANPVAALYMMMLLVGSVLGLLAMVFSIVGLVMAIRNNTPRWIGVTGIVLCLVSLFSFFIPIMGAGMLKDKTPDAEAPKTAVAVADNNEEKETVYEVTIQIFDFGRVRCVNNAGNNVVGNMSTTDYDFKKQFANWLKMNNVDSSSSVLINTTNDADYSDITKVINALKANGITEFELSSTLDKIEYYR